MKYFILLSIILGLICSAEIQQLNVGETYEHIVDQSQSNQEYEFHIYYNNVDVLIAEKFDIYIGYDSKFNPDEKFSSTLYHMDSRFQVDVQTLEYTNEEQANPTWGNKVQKIPKLLEIISQYSIQDLVDHPDTPEEYVVLKINIDEQLGKDDQYTIFIGTRVYDEEVNPDYKKDGLITRNYLPQLHDVEDNSLSVIPMKIYETQSFTNVVDQKHVYHFYTIFENIEETQRYYVKNVFQNNSVGSVMLLEFLENLSQEEIDDMRDILKNDTSSYPNINDQQNEQLYDLAADNQYGQYNPYYSYQQFQNEKLQVSKAKCTPYCVLKATVVAYTGNIAYRHDRKAYIDFFLFKLEDVSKIPKISYNGISDPSTWVGNITKNNKQVLQTLKVERKFYKDQSTKQSIQVQGCVVQDEITKGIYRICEYRVDHNGSKFDNNFSVDKQLKSMVRAPHTLNEEQELEEDEEEFYVHITTSYSDIEKFIFGTNQFQYKNDYSVRVDVQDAQYSGIVKGNGNIEVLQTEQQLRTLYIASDGEEEKFESYLTKIIVYVEAFLTFKEANLIIQNYDDPTDYQIFEDIKVDQEYTFKFKQSKAFKSIIAIESTNNFTDPKAVKEPLALELKISKHTQYQETGFPSWAIFLIIVFCLVLLSFIMRFIIEYNESRNAIKEAKKKGTNKEKLVKNEEDQESQHISDLK